MIFLIYKSIFAQFDISEEKSLTPQAGADFSNGKIFLAGAEVIYRKPIKSINAARKIGNVKFTKFPSKS